MIESIEGKRGMPRLRPPYVAQVGLFGRPTLEHNFETLYWVRELLEKGGAWFASQGRNGRKGLRSFSVSGRVKNPGVKLAPAGITIRELIDEYCGGMQEGHEFYGYLPGGASGGILPAAMGDIPLDFDTLQPHGCFIGSAAVIVLSNRDTAKAAARNMMRFFEHESCGQCTPCRVGTAKTNLLIAHDKWDKPLLADLSQVMRDASICGLGQAAPNPGGLRREISFRTKLPEDRDERHYPHRTRAIRGTDGHVHAERPRTVTGPATDTILEIADREGIEIPRLCYKAGMDAVGNCRSCMVEIKGERVLAASCCRTAQTGMQVTTDSERARKSQQMVIELLQSDMPEKEYTRHNEVDDWAARLDVGKPRFAPRPTVAPDLTQPASPSISTPASSARAACAPAATNRSTMSSASPSAASTQRSCSTWTIPWAHPPASPAASACRRVRPAR